MRVGDCDDHGVSGPLLDPRASLEHQCISPEKGAGCQSLRATAHSTPAVFSVSVFMLASLAGWDTGLSPPLRIPEATGLPLSFPRTS